MTVVVTGGSGSYHLSMAIKRNGIRTDGLMLQEQELQLQRIHRTVQCREQRITSAYQCS